MKSAKQKTPPKKPRSGKTASKNPAAAPYALPASLNIHSVEEVARNLASLGLAEAEGGLDASATELLTSAGIQLLISYDQSLRASGSRLHLRHARHELEDSFRTLGLQSLWQDWTSDETSQQRIAHELAGETHE